MPSVPILSLVWEANSLIYSIEMNVIIIAACIPTLRPVFLVLFRRPGADNFRASVRERGRSSYYRASESHGSKKTTKGSIISSKAFDRASRAMTGSTEAINNKGSVNGEVAVQVESRELGSRNEETEEGEWGHVNGSGVPMTNIGSHRSSSRTAESDAAYLEEEVMV